MSEATNGDVASARSGEPAADERDVDAGTEELSMQVELLRAENRRLREEYARSKQVRYRRTALALGVVGAAAVAAGAAFPDARTVLLILGATGVFCGVLTYYLVPDRIVPTTVGQSAYDAAARDGDALRDELGLQSISVYVPADVGDAGDAPVRLFVPQSKRYDLPSDEELRSTFVATDDERARGVALVPTAAGMVDEFERAVAGDGDDPGEVAAQLCDALVEQFELVRRAEPDLDPDGGRLTVRVSGAAYGDVSRFDHPAASFLGTGLARRLGEAVTVDADADEGGAFLITCRWGDES